MLTNRPVCLVPVDMYPPCPAVYHLHRAIFVQEVHRISLCFGVAELSQLGLLSLFKASSFPGVT